MAHAQTVSQTMVQSAKVVARVSDSDGKVQLEQSRIISKAIRLEGQSANFSLAGCLLRTVVTLEDTHLLI